MKTMHLMKHCARLDAAGRARSRRKILNAVEAMMELHALEQGPVGQLLRDHHRNEKPALACVYGGEEVAT